MASRFDVFALALLSAAQVSVVQADDNDLILSIIPILAKSVSVRRAVPAMGSYENQKSSLHINRQAIRDTRFSGTFVHAVAYLDLDGDLDYDVIMSSGDGSTSTTPIEIYLNQQNGAFALDYGALRDGESAAPGLVHSRKALLCRLNADSLLDVVLIGHGYDQPPFPGESLRMLLSSEDGYVPTTRNDVSGFLHGGACADIDGDGDNDVFVTDNRTPYMLVNDGTGVLTNDASRYPTELRFSQLYTAELVDVDGDGHVDLLVGGHEFDGMPTAVFWGGDDGKFVTSRRTVLEPGGARWGVVVDIDAEDFDGDGDRDVLVTRTGGPPTFYQGYSLQLLIQQARQFVDETDIRIDVPRDENAGWFDWARAQDKDNDGDMDVFSDDAARGLVWLNNGQGNFQRQ